MRLRVACMNSGVSPGGVITMKRAPRLSRRICSTVPVVHVDQAVMPQMIRSALKCRY